jgi:glycosyltransferase involved in cell wall biosynthesis
LAGQLRRVLTSRSLRQELGEAGRRRAALHSWSAAAAGFEEIFTRRTAGLV